MFCSFSPLLILFVSFLCSALKNDKVPVGLRPAKAVNEPQQHEEREEQMGEQTEGRRESGRQHPTEPIIPSISHNGSKPLIFHKNLRNGRKNGGPLGVAFAINETETLPAKARITIPPPIGKDFGVNTILQTNLVDSQGRVLKGVSSVQLPLSEDIHQQKSKVNKNGSRAFVNQVQVEAEANPVQFSGQSAKEKR
ncbi:hypothetical protein niasHT_015774 [Heterodera trifolii]|uniref:Uncharacterized protein n=1 Tax=Heterodera trifolii TaxID=157864 RepID=A0ABD2L503_9BILA